MEPIVGYSRAVVVGSHVFVSGTAPIPKDGAEAPTDAYAQTRLCLDIVRRALEEAGSRLEDVVRTRLYLTDAADIGEVGRAHGEVFHAIRPANTSIVVAALFDPKWRIEIEVDALSPLSK